jgi:DNA-binding response OmpR family regulator
MKNKIGIIEDDVQISRLLQKLLRAHGYETECVCDGRQAMELIEKGLEGYSLLLLDLMLPYFSGEQVLCRLRKSSKVPVIVLSAKGEVQNRIDLIRQGADDYVTKPFDLGEVLVRIEAVLRRTGAALEEEQLRFRELVMDFKTGEVMLEGRRVELSAKEFEILKLLMKNPRKLFSKANIYESVWEEPYFSEGDLVKVHVNHLRRKLQEACPGQEYIETVWGMGYRMLSE